MPPQRGEQLTYFRRVFANANGALVYMLAWSLMLGLIVLTAEFPKIEGIRRPVAELWLLLSAMGSLLVLNRAIRGQRPILSGMLALVLLVLTVSGVCAMLVAKTAFPYLN